MAKGKYAARAANRLVQTDNELLREKVAECEALKRELASVKGELHQALTANASAVTRRAEELSARLIADIESSSAARIASAESNWHSRGRQIAGRMWDYFIGPNKDGHLPRFFVTDIVPMLLPENEVNDFVNSRLDERPEVDDKVTKTNRMARRHALKNIKRNSRIDDNSGGDDKVARLAMSAALGDAKSQELMRGGYRREVEDEQEA